MSATEHIFRSCSSQNVSRSSRRAIVPSSFMTSQITPMGLRPAISAKSTEPSVWPARSSTPPLRARRQSMWPGRVRSEGRVLPSAATRIVRARSAALMPVVTPVAASILIVKAVPNGVVLSAVISGRASWSARSSVIVRQISPRPCLAMKLMISGVTVSAAQTRSPSFSRDSSSTRTIIFPARRSPRISSMLFIGRGLRGGIIARGARRV